MLDRAIEYLQKNAVSPQSKLPSGPHQVTEPTKYEKYKQLAPASIAKYGGRYQVRGGAVETLEGKWSPKRFVILEFPSKQQAKAWWDSPEYREAKLLRQATARTNMICVPGVNELED